MLMLAFVLMHMSVLVDFSMIPSLVFRAGPNLSNCRPIWRVFFFQDCSGSRQFHETLRCMVFLALALALDTSRASRREDEGTVKRDGIKIREEDNGETEGKTKEQRALWTVGQWNEEAATRDRKRKLRQKWWSQSTLLYYPRVHYTHEKTGLKSRNSPDTSRRRARRKNMNERGGERK